MMRYLQQKFYIEQPDVIAQTNDNVLLRIVVHYYGPYVDEGEVIRKAKCFIQRDYQNLIIIEDPKKIVTIENGSNTRGYLTHEIHFEYKARRKGDRLPIRLLPVWKACE